MLRKEDVISQIIEAYEELRTTLSLIESNQLDSVKVTKEGWMVKDILSHLTAWNLQFIIDIEDILRNNTSLQKQLEDPKAVDDFNRKAVGERKYKSYQYVYNEWEKSINTVIKRIKSLTEKEWISRSDNNVWRDGTPITIYSLFEYKYEGKPHEAGHSDEIKRFFGM